MATHRQLLKTLGAWSAGSMIAGGALWSAGRTFGGARFRSTDGRVGAPSMRPSRHSAPADRLLIPTGCAGPAGEPPG